MEESIRTGSGETEESRAGRESTIDGFDLPVPGAASIPPRGNNSLAEPKRGRGRPPGISDGNRILDARGNLKRDAEEYGLFTLDYAFRRIGGRKAAIDLAELLSGSDERMAAVVAAYKALSAGTRKHSPRLLEKLCAEAGIDPSEFLGKCAGAAHKQQLINSALLAGSQMEEIVLIGTEMAKLPEGIADRKLIYEHMAFLPQKQGVGVAIQVNAGSGTATSLPNFSDLAAIASGALGSQKQLSAAEEGIIDGELISERVMDVGSANSESTEDASTENS